MDLKRMGFGGRLLENKRPSGLSTKKTSKKRPQLQLHLLPVSWRILAASAVGQVAQVAEERRTAKVANVFVPWQSLAQLHRGSLLVQTLSEML